MLKKHNNWGEYVHTEQNIKILKAGTIQVPRVAMLELEAKGKGAVLTLPLFRI